MRLLRSKPHSSAELSSKLRVSQSTVSRALQGLIDGERVVRLGSRTRGARYEAAVAVPFIIDPHRRPPTATHNRFSSVVVRSEERAQHYPQLAAQRLRGEVARPVSVGLPSFTVTLVESLFDGMPAALLDRRHVVVYFTPPLSTEDGKLAAEALRAQQVAFRHFGSGRCARSSLITLGDRTYRQVDSPFADGRFEPVPVQSIAHVESLRAARCISGETLATLRLAVAFLTLISGAVPDLCRFNLVREQNRPRALTLAPVDDLFAVVTKPFASPPPLPELAAAWETASDMASRYWFELTLDPALSAATRALAQQKMLEMLGATLDD